jgi:hypothetical protein
MHSLKMAETSRRKRFGNKYGLGTVPLSPKPPWLALSDLQAFQKRQEGPRRSVHKQNTNKLEMFATMPVSPCGAPFSATTSYGSAISGRALQTQLNGYLGIPFRRITFPQSTLAQVSGQVSQRTSSRSLRPHVLRKVRDELGKNATVVSCACRSELGKLPCGTC